MRFKTAQNVCRTKLYATRRVGAHHIPTDLEDTVLSKLSAVGSSDSISSRVLDNLAW